MTVSPRLISTLALSSSGCFLFLICLSFIFTLTFVGASYTAANLRIIFLTPPQLVLSLLCGVVEMDISLRRKRGRVVAASCG